MENQEKNNLRGVFTACKQEYTAALEKYADTCREAIKEYERADHLDCGAFYFVHLAIDKAGKEFSDNAVDLNRQLRAAIAETENEARERQIHIEALGILKRAAVGLFLFEPKDSERRIINGGPFHTQCSNPEEEAAEAAAEKLIDDVERELAGYFASGE